MATIVNTIGSRWDRDYPTPQAWESATRALAGLGNDYHGMVYMDDPDDYQFAAGSELVMQATVPSVASGRRELYAAPGHEYDPRTGRGVLFRPTMTSTSGHGIGLSVSGENFFRTRDIGFVQTGSASSGTHHGILVNAAGCEVYNCYVECAIGDTAADIYGIVMEQSPLSTGPQGDFICYGNIVVGSGLSDTGARGGIRVVEGASPGAFGSGSRVYNNDVWRITNTDVWPGSSFGITVTSPNAHCINNIVHECDSAFGVSFSTDAFRFSANLSDDAATVAGGGLEVHRSFVENVSRTWVAPEFGDFRLRPTSQALDTGRILANSFQNENSFVNWSSTHMYRSFSDRSARAGIWDMGAYEGSALDFDTPVTEVLRPIGVGRGAVDGYDTPEEWEQDTLKSRVGGYQRDTGLIDIDVVGGNVLVRGDGGDFTTDGFGSGDFITLLGFQAADGRNKVLSIARPTASTSGTMTLAYPIAVELNSDSLQRVVGGDFKDTRQVGVLQGEEFDLGTGYLVIRSTEGDAERRRELRAESNGNYVPSSGIGPLVRASTSTGAVGTIDVEDRYFKGLGFGVLQDSSALAQAQHCIRVRAPDVVLDAMWLYHPEGTSKNRSCLFIQSGLGDRAVVTDTIFKGSGTSFGAARGARVEAADCKLSNCDAVDIVGSDASFGFGFDFTESSSRGYNLIADNCRQDFNVTTFRNLEACTSSDASAVGPGAQKNVPGTSIFVNPNQARSGYADYRVLATSPTLRSGVNRFDLTQFDQAGERRFAPFDRGAYSGFARAQQFAAPDRRLSTRHRLVQAVRVERLDGFSVAVTDHNMRLPYDGQVYEPAGGVQTSAQRGDSGLRPGSMEAIGFFDLSYVTAADLRAGLWHGARIVIDIVDWLYPFAAPSDREVYYVRDIEYDGESWRWDVVGVAGRLDTLVGRVHGETCTADLGDKNCRVDLEPLTHYDVPVKSVVVGAERYAFTVDVSDLPTGLGDEWFANNGLLTWSDGDNSGEEGHVKTYVEGTDHEFELQLDTTHPIQVGDEFTIRPGCSHLKDDPQGCGPKYANTDNYQGNTYLASTDEAFQSPRP